MRVLELDEVEGMSHENVGVAVIGYGYWGPNLVRNLANTNSAQLIAVSDLDPAKLAICKRLHPGVMIFANHTPITKSVTTDKEICRLV